MHFSLIWSAFGLWACLNGPKADPPQPPDSEAVEAQTNCLPISHAWTSKTASKSTHSLNLCIDKTDLASAIDTFGIQESDLSFQYSSPDELKHLVKQRNAAIQGRGFELLLEGERVSAHVNYKHLVKHANTGTAARELRSMLPTAASDRQIIEFFADYVQSFELEDLSSKQTHTDPSGRITAGTRHPLETLSKGSGDCDALATLFAALAYAHTDAPIAFLALKIDGINHLVPAIGIKPEPNDVVSLVEDNPMVVFDMTSRDPALRTSTNVRTRLNNQSADVLWIRTTEQP